MSIGVWPPTTCHNPDHLVNCTCAVRNGLDPEAPLPDQFRASLNRHIDKLIEEEEEMWDDRLIHEYAASILRELKAWIETGA